MIIYCEILNLWAPGCRQAGAQRFKSWQHHFLPDIDV